MTTHPTGPAAYGLGETDRERQRLIDQAALMKDRTRRLLVEAGIGPGMRVLDLGCGVGDVSLIAASLVGAKGSVVGVDLDGRSLEWAKRRVDEAGLAHVSFLEVDLESLSLDEAFDAVIGRFILMHVKDPSATLARITKHLKDDGIVAFQESYLAFPPLFEPEPVKLWQQWLDWILAASETGGVETRMGLKLHRAFVDAGLPPPTLRMEVPLFTPGDVLGARVAAEALRSLLPALEKSGIASVEDVGIDSFADRLSDEIAAKRAVCTSFGLVDAWSQGR